MASSLQRWPKLSVVVLSVTAGAVIALAAYSSRPAKQQLYGTNQAAVGRKLTTIKLQPLTGTDDQVRANDLRGKVVIINFWATWCAPCAQELPHLADLHKRFGQRGDFVLLAISCDDDSHGPDELRRATREYLDSAGVAMPTYWDPGNVTKAAVKSTVGFEGLPTTLVLDQNGTVQAMWEGYKPGFELQLEMLVEALLAE